MNPQAEQMLNGETSSIGGNQLHMRFNGGCAVDHGANYSQRQQEASHFDRARSPADDTVDYCRMQPMAIAVESTDDVITDLASDSHRQALSIVENDHARQRSYPSDYNQGGDRTRLDPSAYMHARIHLPVDGDSNRMDVAERVQTEVERYYSGIMTGSSEAESESEMCCGGVDYSGLVGPGYQLSYSGGPTSYANDSALQHHLVPHQLPSLSIVSSDKVNHHSSSASSDGRFQQLFPVVEDNFASSVQHQHSVRTGD
jgi:hypothetical protein